MQHSYNWSEQLRHKLEFDLQSNETQLNELDRENIALRKQIEELKASGMALGNAGNHENN